MTRIVFMGTPEFAVPAVSALNERYQVVLVVTQPDRPRGRGRKTVPSAVKAAAKAMGLPVVQPKILRGEEFADLLASCRPDFLVTAAYGRILPPTILQVRKIAAVNIHASLLPRYRGAAPIHRAVINGETASGITIMHIEEGIDTGDIISQKSVIIASDTTAGELHDILSQLGADMIVEALPALLDGTAVRVKQDDTMTTWAPPLTAGEEEINWRISAQAIHNLVRGMNPRPVAYTYFQENRLKVWSGRPKDNEKYCSAAGTVLAAGAEGIQVAAGKGSYLILELQPAGKRVMTAAEYLSGNTLLPGEVLGRRCADGSP